MSHSKEHHRHHRHRSKDGVSGPKVGCPMPDFKGTAVINGEFTEISLADFKGKYFVLFFYPINFSIVCPTELIAFSDRMPEFAELNVNVVACAPDSQYSHKAFLETPREKNGLSPGLAFPLLSDFNRKICKDYNVLSEPDQLAYRGLFICDNKGILRFMSMNGMAVGRNVDEVIRVIKAFHFSDEFGEVCPANWKPGDKGIKVPTA